MAIADAWEKLAEALAFAARKVTEDPDPMNERELADGNQYVVRALTASVDATLMTFDPFTPGFLPQLESVRFVGGSGPDIDYDVSILIPGLRYRIEGARGGATFVGICVYTHDGERGATAIVDSIDVDAIVRPDGTFTYEFEHPQAARVIIRQYFHDRATQRRGTWTIRFAGDAPTPPPGFTPGRIGLAELEARVTNLAESITWNAHLNDLWSPERRNQANEFVHQSPHEIVAAITNPDVNYSFTWWRVPPDHAILVEFTPPETDYWSLQVLDRWFQCFPDRKAGLHDREAVANADGSYRLVLADGDPGVVNWLDTSGHHLGVMFFRWLHAEASVQPTCRVVPLADL